MRNTEHPKEGSRVSRQPRGDYEASRKAQPERPEESFAVVQASLAPQIKNEVTEEPTAADNTGYEDYAAKALDMLTPTNVGGGRVLTLANGDEFPDDPKHSAQEHEDLFDTTAKELHRLRSLFR